MYNVIFSRLILILLTVLIILISGCNREENKQRAFHSDVLSFLKSQLIRDSLSLMKEENKLLLIINFDDFNCQPCYDDFLDLCDTLTARYEKKGIQPPVLMVIKEGNEMQLDKPERLKVWQGYNNANFKSVIVPDSVFKAYFKISTLLIVKKDTQIVFRKELPIGLKTRLKLFEFL